MEQIGCIIKSKVLIKSSYIHIESVVIIDVHFSLSRSVYGLMFISFFSQVKKLHSIWTKTTSQFPVRLRTRFHCANASKTAKHINETVRDLHS